MAWRDATSLVDREGPRQGVRGVCRHRSRWQGAYPLWIDTVAASNKGAHLLSLATDPSHVDDICYPTTPPGREHVTSCADQVEKISVKPLQWTSRWRRTPVFSNKQARLVELMSA